MMLFSELIQRFEQNAPMTVMSRALLENVLSSERIDGIFDRVAHPQDGNKLMFSTVADIMGLVTTKVYPTVHAAFVARDVGVTAKALYDKLQRIHPEVSRALVRDLAVPMMEIMDHLPGALAPLAPRYNTKIIDGNHLRRTERRIDVLRELNAAPLPGHALVVLDPQKKLIVDVFPCEDGHAQERRLLPDVLDTVKPRDLWIADRNFCTKDFLWGIANRDASFVIRQHANLTLTFVGKRKHIGRCDSGVVYEQETQLSDKQGNQLTLRRITVRLDKPTRDGDWEIHVLTNVAKRMTALRVAELYAKRWRIETAFQELATCLHGEVVTLGYPKAALFAFSMALVAYNVLSVVRAALRAAHGETEVEDRVSLYHMALEVSRTAVSIQIAIPETYWKETYAGLSAAKLAKELVRIAKTVNLSRYRKIKRGPKKPKPKKGRRTSTHVSTAFIIKKFKQPKQAAKC